MFLPLVCFNVGKKIVAKLCLLKSPSLVLLIVAQSCDQITRDQGLSLLPQGKERRHNVDKVNTVLAVLREWS